MICTLSCSTSLRVALTATSGLASDDALMISIFLPATMPLRSFTADLGAAHAVCAARGERSFQRREQADLDRLLRIRAAGEAQRRRHRRADQRAYEHPLA